MQVNSSAPAQPFAGPNRAIRHGYGDDLVIGILNIVAPGAMRQTEQNFIGLLGSGAGRRNVRVRLFTLASSSAQAGTLPYLVKHYEAFEDIWNARLDGLIVTGTEPKAASMAGEPCWPALAALLDWAASNTISTIWSCFAAHAAVYRLDGIVRQPLQQKLTGVFECGKVAAHDIMSGVPARFAVPHSRHNTLKEETLREAGYSILSHAPRVDADMFIKRHGSSLFLFFQGHPEYSHQNLLLEYRRDIKRFLSGQSETYPKMPEGYFSQDMAAAFAALREQAIKTPGLALGPGFDKDIAARMAFDWDGPARAMYQGWLSYIAAQKVKRSILEPDRLRWARIGS